MRLNKAIIATIVVVAALLLAAPVLAYDEVGPVNPDCAACHGEASPSDIKGPHGGYTTTTRKCQTCHEVHAAVGGGSKLLPAATIKGVCETCHDGSGGSGVYGTVVARGLTVGASHSIDTTNVVPGGDEGTGDDAQYTFSGENGYLTCSDCHSPHDANTVDDFTGDRSRSDTSTIGYVSNRLLKQRPNGSDYAIPEYGSDWCGACHLGRLVTGSGVNNHPVESTAVAGYYYYDNTTQVTTYGVSTVQTGTMGRNNRGFVMPYPRDALQSGHYPVCMQCHEDGRNVGDSTFGQLAAGEVFTVTTADGTTAGDNPRLQTFPHETVNTNLLVETNDDLCTNCHDPIAQLP